MDLSHVFDLGRWPQRFRSEQAVADRSVAEGRVPDATVDDVGAAPPSSGFDGSPLPGGPGNGHGTGDVGGPGWGA